MTKATDMMTLTAEQRRDYFRKAYTIELARLHATGVCRWPADQLPVMVSKAMDAALSRNLPIGAAMDATRKMFGLKTNKATFEFLGV